MCGRGRSCTIRCAACRHTRACRCRSLAPEQVRAALEAKTGPPVGRFARRRGLYLPVGYPDDPFI